MSQKLQRKPPSTSIIVRAIAAVLPDAAWDAIKYAAPVAFIALGGAGLTTSVMARVLLSIPVGLTLALTFSFSFLALLAGMVIYQRRWQEAKELTDAMRDTNPPKSTQEGVTIQVNPVISPQIIQNQTISQAAEHQSQLKAIEPPSIKPIEAGIRKMWIDSGTLEISGRRRQATFEGDELTPIDVAFIKFYRDSDNSSMSWVEVRAHIQFCNVNGNPLFRIDKALWLDKEGIAVSFEKLQAAGLVVAFFQNGEVHPYTGYYEEEHGGYPCFIYEGQKLDGNNFHVIVEFIGTRGGQTLLEKQSIDCDLTISPTLEFKLRET